MKPATIYRWIVIIALIGLLEVLCVTGVITKITMQPPHRIVVDLYKILVSGSLNKAILKTFANAASAFLLRDERRHCDWRASSIARDVSAKSRIHCSRPITRSRSSPSIRY